MQDTRQFKEQMRVLVRLKKRSLRKLRRMHKEVFAGTEWFVRLPEWMSKDTIVRRLWFYYCYTHYHYPDDHEVTIHFRKRAAEFLDPANLTERHEEEVARNQLRDLERFSKTNILTMDINQIDRYLAGLGRAGIHVDAPEDVRRRILWEYFNLPQSLIIRTNNAKGNRVRRYRHGRINNKWALKDLILVNQGMGYDAFRATFGEVMPTVTRSSFNTARSLLRKMGYQIERIKPGPAHPVVVEDKDGNQTKGRLDEAE